MLQSLLTAWLLWLAVGRLEVVLKPKVSQPSRSSVGCPAPASLAKTDIDVAG